MLKTHDLKTIVVNHTAFNYFYTKERCDTYGNPRYRVFIIDPDGPGVYERIFKTYCVESSIASYIENYLEGDIKK
jgi:hypothetical protein